MNIDLHSLVLISTAYLLVLFICAWSTEKGLIPKKLVQHPLTYVLSLGVYASSWAFYGSIGVAHDSGYVFLAFYFGLSGAFFLAPVLLTPILRIIQRYQLGSLADLFAFRFRSPIAGTLSTLLLLITVMPLLALQIQAVSDSIHLISKESSPETLAIGFCILITLFTMLFGARHITSRDHHQGLVFAIAVESLLKLLVMVILGSVVLFQVFGSFDGLDQWLTSNAGDINGMKAPLENSPWRTTLLMFFASAIVMPHMFHMTFTENRDRRALHTASWGLPLFLLLLSISTPLILWAGIKLEVDIPPEYFPLAIGQILEIQWLTIIVYLGGLAAASGLIIVTSLALSSMVLNHLVLPWYQTRELLQSRSNIYRQLIWLKRLLISMLILASYGFYRLLTDDQNLYNLSVVAYAGALQLLPGALCTLYWEKANNKGFISGLIAGTSVWFVTLMLPLTVSSDLFLGTNLVSQELMSEHWHVAAMSSLFVNVLVFLVISSLTSMRAEEIRAAQSCLVKRVRTKGHSVPKASSPVEFQEMLCSPLGPLAAQKEVTKALAELKIRPDEKRPHALARLRDKIETNLSGLMGPAVAHDIVDSFLPLDSDKSYVAQDLHFLEAHLEAYHSKLTGLAAEMDSLRRYHRDTLSSIPLGVCSIGNNDIITWNHSMEQMTGLDAENVLGSPLHNLPEPWSTLFSSFMGSDINYLNKHRLEVNGEARCFSLHKANMEVQLEGYAKNQVMLMEDMTENQMLEEQLAHSERLASIGQLAAGVAHEIGNPITGIDCLAQELKAFSPDPEIKKTAKQILDQTKRVGNIVQMLVSYAHSGQSKQNSHQKGAVCIHACVNEAIGLLKLNKKHDNLIFRNECHPKHQVAGSSQKLQQVFINLLSNAADASRKGGLITVKSATTQHTLNIEVEDQGHGIPKKIQEKLFDPFFTTKEAGKGTGLGLALTWNIIEEHFGTIRVISPSSQSCLCGTCFIITLPLYQPDAFKQLQGVELQGETV